VNCRNGPFYKSSSYHGRKVGVADIAAHDDHVEVVEMKTPGGQLPVAGRFVVTV